MLTLCASSFCYLPNLVKAIVPFSIEHIPGLFSVMASSLLLLGLPGVCLGIIPPLCVASVSEAKGNRDIGVSSASVSISLTLGGVTGTIVTGFILLPLLGATKLSVFISVYLFLIVTVCALVFRLKPSIAFFAFLAAIIIGLIPFLGTPQSTSLDIWEDTEYGRVHVYDGYYNTRPVRYLNIDGGFESAMYIDDTSAPVFSYLVNAARIMDDTLGDDGRFLCLGGGGYGLPKYEASSYTRSVDVVEIDKGVTEIARKYFELNTYEELFKDRLTTYNMDARVYLMNSGKKYDVIFNDTFAGLTPARGLATREAAFLVKDRLNSNGIYVINAIGIADRDGEGFLTDEIETLSTVFPYVHVLWHEVPNDLTKRQNYIIVAADDDDWKIPSGYVEIPVSSTKVRILTDDDCPVEVIVSADRRANEER